MYILYKDMERNIKNKNNNNIIFSAKKNSQLVKKRNASD